MYSRLKYPTRIHAERFPHRKMAGYSKTPLFKKLGIKEGSKLYVLNAPDSYRAALEPLPAKVEFVPRLTTETNIVHAFFDSRAKLEKALTKYRGQLNPAAAIWISWPKKASKVVTDITEDVVREIALPLGLVDVKVCAVDDVWSGLKLVIRKS